MLEPRIVATSVSRLTDADGRGPPETDDVPAVMRRVWTHRRRLAIRNEAGARDSCGWEAAGPRATPGQDSMLRSTGSPTTRTRRWASRVLARADHGVGHAGL